MEKASVPPQPYVCNLADLADSPDWVGCRLCDDRASDILPFQVCAKCALDIHDHIARANGRWVADVRIIEDIQERLAQQRAAQECVYYIRRRDRIKIGTTTNLTARMAALLPDEILAVEPGGRDMEVGRHQQFATLRVRGEWFRDDPTLREHIASLVQQHGTPPAAAVF